MIIRKRIYNSWWGGKDTGKPSIVNQAGQYALPGGKVDKGEKPEEAGLREFKEESGKRIGFHDGFQEVHKTSEFVAVAVVMKSGELDNLMNAVTLNVQAGSEGKAPKSDNVKDWEWDQVFLVDKAQVTQFLGVSQPLGKDADAVNKNARAYSQSIDWYAQIAKSLAK